VPGGPGRPGPGLAAYPPARAVRSGTPDRRPAGASATASLTHGRRVRHRCSAWPAAACAPAAIVPAAPGPAGSDAAWPAFRPVRAARWRTCHRSATLEVRRPATYRASARAERPAGTRPAICGSPPGLALGVVNRSIYGQSPWVKNGEVCGSRWETRGAHRLPQIRTRALNDQLAGDFHRWHSGFRYCSPDTEKRQSPRSPPTVFPLSIY